MVSNIQALRAFAALAIVFYHRDMHIMGYHSEFYGVQLFFAKSGFIMMMVSRHDAWRRFMIKRVTRIIPIYWAFTLVVFFRDCLAYHKWDSAFVIVSPTAAGISVYRFVELPMLRKLRTAFGTVPQRPGEALRQGTRR